MGIAEQHVVQDENQNLRIICLSNNYSQFKKLSYFEQLEQVFLVEAGGRQAGTVYPVRHSVEQKSWVEPFLWYAVCPFWRIFLQPEQETRTAVPGTEGSILLMPEDATAGWKPDDSCGAKIK